MWFVTWWIGVIGIFDWGIWMWWRLQSYSVWWFPSFITHIWLFKHVSVMVWLVIIFRRWWHRFVLKYITFMLWLERVHITDWFIWLWWIWGFFVRFFVSIIQLILRMDLEKLLWRSCMVLEISLVVLEIRLVSLSIFAIQECHNIWSYFLRQMQKKMEKGQWNHLCIPNIFMDTGRKWATEFRPVIGMNRSYRVCFSKPLT